MKQNQPNSIILPPKNGESSILPACCNLSTSCAKTCQFNSVATNLLKSGLLWNLSFADLQLARFCRVFQHSYLIFSILGVARVLSELPRPQIEDGIKQICIQQVQLLAQLLGGQNGSHSEPIMYLDRIATIFRYVYFVVQQSACLLSF